MGAGNNKSLAAVGPILEEEGDSDHGDGGNPDCGIRRLRPMSFAPATAFDPSGGYRRRHGSVVAPASDHGLGLGTDGRLACDGLDGRFLGSYAVGAAESKNVLVWVSVVPNRKVFATTAFP